MGFTVEEPDNYQQKCLCLLLLDVSGSMARDHKLEMLNDAVKQMYDDIIYGKNGVEKSTKDRLFVEVISFDQAPHRVQRYMLLNEATSAPVLTTRGSTTNTVRAIDFAIKEIEAHKAMLKEQGQKYYRPWLILVTDGNPSSSAEEVDRIARVVKKEIDDGRMAMTAVGVGDKVSLDMLNKLSANHGTKLKDYSFARFFDWLAKSTDGIFKSDDEFDREVGFDIRFL